MDYATGTLGIGGDQLQAVELSFSGDLGQDFIDFAQNRMHRLGLDGQVTSQGADVILAIQGPEALIDALEITCSLGPIQSRIDFWSRRQLG